MKSDIFNIKQNRWWAVIPLIILIWHAIYISYTQSPDYLFFVCYPANLILIIGILFRISLFIGVGFGWTLIGFPLWLYDSHLTGNYELSCTLFHLAGILVGFMTVKQYIFPRFTWLAAILLALFMQITARIFTDEKLNINAAFRVYEGWEGAFSNYTIYMIAMMFGFALFFLVFTTVSNWVFHRESK
ncbi:MAG: hypothetical protein KKE17_00710 [Proteobacteria bacterium]|nr:hypothetical protein [Pseudomonadota bacterium]MBU1708501.1 hypothetical protein [Pseudomonadota bacterium]